MQGVPEPTEAILVADEMKGEGNRRHVRTESFFCWVKQGPGQMARALPLQACNSYTVQRIVDREKEIHMPPTKDEHLKDVAILTRAVENVFRKLIRFLVGRISLVKLQEMIRFIYVEEAERKLNIERPDRNILLTRLAILTGLDTRTLTKVRNSERYRKPLYLEKRFLKAMTPESCVLDIWSSNPKYLDSTGKPRQIAVANENNSFEQLVKEAVSSRGITAQSIMERLIANKAVKFDEDTETIELLEKIQAPFKTGDEWGILEVGFLQTGNLLDTVFYNFQAVRDETKPFYQRGCWTHRLNQENRVKFRNLCREILKESDERARNQMMPYEERVSTDDQMTAGISMFYFEEGMEVS